MSTFRSSTSSEGQPSSSRPASARPTSARSSTSSRSSAASYSSHTAASTAKAAQSTEAESSSKPNTQYSASRVQKLFGLASVTSGQQYSSSRLAYIPLELLRVTAEDKPATNLLEPGRKSCWSTASGQNHELVFKISSACLLGFVKILNRSVSHLEIYVSMHDVANQYVLIQSDLHSPHNKTIMYPTGFLPCRYVKVKCVRGTPCAMYKSVLMDTECAPVALQLGAPRWVRGSHVPFSRLPLCVFFSVSVVGVLERVVWREMGPQMGSMIVEHPEALLLPAKPHLQKVKSLTFPSHQTIKQQEPAPPIERVTRQ